MDCQRHIILIDGADRTRAVDSISLEGNRYAVKFVNGGTIYRYSYDKVTWLTKPEPISPAGCHVYVKGKKEHKVRAIAVFTAYRTRYYAITYDNGYTGHYHEDEVDIRQSCLTGAATNVFDYLSRCASVNTLGKDENDESSEGILSSIYSRIDFIDTKTAAAVYLNPGHKVSHRRREAGALYAFGCNASQNRAVKTALASQISVIQGPPGTGKTQTILNIIANLLVEGKTVLVVSNNNSATTNVQEKLAKCGLDFLVAPLGSRENREAFVANQPPLNPELPTWHRNKTELQEATKRAQSSLKKLESVFDMQQRLAVCRQELADLQIEQTHFEQEHSEHFEAKKQNISSAKILKILGRIKSYALKHGHDTQRLLGRLRQMLDKLRLELSLRFVIGIKDELTIDAVPQILTQLEWLFYVSRAEELRLEIASLETSLSAADAVALTEELTVNSMTVLKATIAKRIKQPRAAVATVREIYNGGDKFLANYPVVLSTTFSARNCLGGDTLFDYVIMDEASQVSVDTGALALTCAKNAVIVGDIMQLPNVVTDDDAVRLDEIRRQSGIGETYDAAKHSFLSSVLATISDVPQTLLREHYRCHPDIINFCNQKFYGGNLLVMTERRDDSQHLMAITTAEGQHCRGHYNQREIDVVKLELLPELGDLSRCGIIAPYNSQVDQFSRQIPEVEAATVHKYQGREKDTIIMSVTDDLITEFADNANLLNVAVSRAKDRFCLVVSGNPQPLKGNIHDLLSYIRYRQGEVKQSRLRSIYDYLFSQVEADTPKERVSEYESENLTYELIERIREQYAWLSHIKTLCHYPMRSLIGDLAGLSEREARYAMHPATHIDFLIINRVSKEPLLAIETDGYSYHNESTEQYSRDQLKDRILAQYGLPLLRLSTTGHSEEQQIVAALSSSLTGGD